MRPALFDDLQEIRKVAAEGRLDDARAQLEHVTSNRVPMPGDHLQCAELAMELGLLKVAERELQLELRDLRAHPEPGRQHRTLSALAEVSEALGQRARAHSFRALAARARGEVPEPPPKVDPLGPIEARKAGQGSATSPPIAPEIRVASPAKTSTRSPRPVEARQGQMVRDADNGKTRPTPTRRSSSQGLKPPGPSDIARFLHLFAGRENVHARQWLDPAGRGGYSPVPKALTHELLSQHFAGTMTLGVYQTRIDGSVTFFALDLDATKVALSRAVQSPREAAELAGAIESNGLRMQRAARELGLDLLLEDSGYKGRHLWGFLESPMAAGLMRNFVKALGRALAPNDERLSLECFPKQEKLDSSQIGNLIKLPLGIHLKSGRRAQILSMDGEVAEDPWRLLAEARRHTHEEIMEVFARLKSDAALSTEPAGRSGPVAAATPDFVASDFDNEPTLRTVLSGCAVLRTLVKRGLESRRLTHDEQIVIRHTLGHLPVGVEAVNHVFRRCPEVATETFLKSVLAGNPISCPKIRKKIPQVTSKLPCNCHFGDHLDHYPTPNLHLRSGASCSLTMKPALLLERGAVPTLPSSGVLQRPGLAESAARDVPEATSPALPTVLRSPLPTAVVAEIVLPVIAASEPQATVPGAQPYPPLDIELAVRRFWQVTERAHRIGLELAAAEHQLLEALGAHNERYEDADGTIDVVRTAGVPKIRFVPRARPEAK